MFLSLGLANAANTDTSGENIWNKISASENFHLLDNATPASFYDFNSGTWYAGVSTSIYKFKKLSIDFGGVRTMEKSSAILPMFGLNRTFLERSDKDFKFFENLSVGIWYCREFKSGTNLFGIYGGYAAKF
jgi:hypothetical protein